MQRARSGGTGHRKRSAGRSVSPLGSATRGKRGNSPSGSSKRSRSSMSSASSVDSFNTASTGGNRPLAGEPVVGGFPQPVDPPFRNVDAPRPKFLPGYGPSRMPYASTLPPPPPYVPIARARDGNTAGQSAEDDLQGGGSDSDYSVRTPTAPPASVRSRISMLEEELQRLKQERGMEDEMKDNQLARKTRKETRDNKSRDRGRRADAEGAAAEQAVQPMQQAKESIPVAPKDGPPATTDAEGAAVVTGPGPAREFL